MSLRILLADDHPVVRIGVRSVIEAHEAGQIAAEAGTVDELFALLSEQVYDILVTDLSMPGPINPDGYAMVERICRNYPDLPVLVLSMTSNASILRLLQTAGVLGLLDKASSMAELPTAIQAIRRGSVYVSAPLRRLLAQAGLRRPHAAGQRLLSPREVEVLRLVAKGMRVKEIALQLNRGITTISKQKSDAARKLGIRNDVELFDFLRREGFSG
ncbi:response regulator transcription factor [Dyella sp. LX-66]|uniref:response regulator transcription factor n=1 Tax=unclassified Dyella TaxID=2634549 RepID=UPI001BDFC5D8|nr:MULTISPECIES: response regulator transcription factor [unclassified Dyella]MBT2117661.1 response regulator transcription factor [Dyella sp. LX-1]MBT2141335.1 response regulator transcription factor [Dyella sp. LX-66]